MLNPKTLCVAVLASLPLVAGCSPGQPNADRQALAGIWSLTRGNAHLKVGWTIANGGETESDSNTRDLQPLAPADFPTELVPLVDQWNNDLADLNATLDAAMPDSVIVTFPNAVSMTLTDPTDATKTGTGLINDQNEYLFAGDLSGGGQGSDQGGGAALDFASITGQFNQAALTISGEIARTLIVVLSGQQNSGLAFIATITVGYTGQRTGDVP